jgi:hypothetical protein
LGFYGYDRARRAKSSLRGLVSAAARIAGDGIRDRFMVLLPVPATSPAQVRRRGPPVSGTVSHDAQEAFPLFENLALPPVMISMGI